MKNGIVDPRNHLFAALVDVLRVQLIENLQREGLHEMEEAEGYHELMQLEKCQAEDIAARVGKSRSYVYRRLKLLALCPEARASFYGGKLNASSALLIARIPVHDLQRKCIKELAGDRWDGPMSYRQARDHIERQYMLALKSAPFPVGDADLVPKAGACGDCPKRTGNQKELFGDIRSPDVCTDPVCFAAKREAHSARLRAQAEAAGRTVITGKEAKRAVPQSYSDHLEGFVKPAERCWQDPKDRTYRQLLGKDAPEPVLIENPHNGQLIEAFRKADVAKVLKDKGVKLERDGGGSYSDERKREDARRRQQGDYRQRLLAAIRAVPFTMTREDLVTIAVGYATDIWHEHRKALLKLWGWEATKKTHGGYGGPDVDGTIESEVQKLDPGQLGRFLLDCVLVPELHVFGYNNDRPEQLLAAAKRFGVDAEKIRAEVAAEFKAKAADKAARARKKATKDKAKATKKKARARPAAAAEASA